MREALNAQSVKAALITPQSPWQMVDVHGSLDSTNLEALRSPRPWRVVVADHQSAGRGRLSRQWEAPVGASIAVSCVVPMPVGRTADWGWLPLLAGMAVRQAVADVAGVAGRLKWPNDVLVQERADGVADHGGPWLKISGVLCEMVPGGGLVVVGVGANVDQSREELPVDTASSLALCGARNIRRQDLIVRYLEVLAELHEAWSGGGAGLDALRAAYRSSCLTIGREVDVHQPGGRVVRGAATGVDDIGRLVLGVGGSSTYHAAGDVVHVRRSPPPAGHGMIGGGPTRWSGEGGTGMPRVGRHRTGPPDELAGGFSPAADDVETRLLGQPRSMRPRDVSAKASMSLRSARKFWHALGFPNVEDDDAAFTEADLIALRSMARLVRDGVFDEPTGLAMTRAFARTTDRLAVWQTQLMAESMGELTRLAGGGGSDDAGTGTGMGTGAGAGAAGAAGVARSDAGTGTGAGGAAGTDEAEVDPDMTRAVPDPETARAAAVKLADIADDLEPLLIYAWRRHMSAAIARMVADAEPTEDDTGVVRCVGFADLVSFTRLVRRLSERELAHVVQRFEALASDVVTAHGGRVIKTVGDEVLFVAMGSAPAAAIALDLVEAMAEDDVLPDVRVGMASGQVVSRLGDVFGITVNRASRLTAVARPGTVLVDDAIAGSLASISGFEMSPLRRRTLRGIGPVTPWSLRRAHQAGRRGMTDDDETGDDGDEGDLRS